MLFRKVLFDCLLFFSTVLLSLSIIIWVFQAVNYLDIILEDGRDYIIYLYFTLLNLPKIISRIFPFAIFFSFIYVISKYELKNELLIFWSVGINKIKLYNFLFRYSIILTIIQIFLTSLVVPKSQEFARGLLRNSDVNFIGNFLKTKNFNDIIKGLTIYIEDKDENNNLKNIFLKKQNSDNDFQITYASKGFFQNDINSKNLILINGETISFIDNKITKFNFSKTSYNLTYLKSNTITITKTQENSTVDLISCIFYLLKKNTINPIVLNIKNYNCTERNLVNIFSEIYKRLVIPLYIPILIMLSLNLILISKERKNYFKIRGLIFLVGLLLIIFSETTIRFINQSFLHNFKIAFIPILLIIINYFFILHKLRVKKIIR